MFGKKKFTIFILIALSLIGAATSLFISSKWGIGISPDSAVYINVSRNLLNGLGLSALSSLGGTSVTGPGASPELVPLTHFPPLFPLLLSCLGMFGVDPLVGARWIAALLFGANIAITGFIIYRVTGSLWFSIFGSLLILTSADMIRIHSFAWSEPLFIFLGMLGLYSLSSYLVNLRVSGLVCSCAGISLAFLDRYVGLSLVIAGMIGILILNGERYRERITHSALFAFLSSLPVGLWIVRGLYLGQTATHRELHFHPVTYSVVKSGVSDVLEWILPYRGPIALKVIVVGVLLLSLFVISTFVRRKEKSWPVGDKTFCQKICGLLELFVAVYVGFLIISLSFFDASTRLDGRILVPIYPSLVIVVVSRINWITMFVKRYRIVEGGLVLACVGFMVFNAGRAFIGVVSQYENGAYSYNNKFNYNNKSWRQSEVIEEVKKIPSGTILYTNVPDAIYLLAGKVSYKVPSKENYLNRQVNGTYLSELELMGKDIWKRNGELVYFSGMDVGNLPSGEEFKGISDVMLDKQLKDGSIYRARR